MPEKNTELRKGTIVAILTYSMWGLFPLYWKQLLSVNPLQVLCHRVVWAAFFTLLALVVGRKASELPGLLRRRKTVLVVLGCGFFISINWGVYIWAVNTGHLIESSLGYYINPLVSIAIGAVFFAEKLDRWTRIAVGLACLGVLSAALMMGSLPWISLVLALSYAIYGALKKYNGLEPIAGLAAETLAVAPFALAWIVREHAVGRGVFGGPDIKVNLLLVLSGIVTALPLATFAYAANRISLQRMGFIQYISPSLQFLLGIFLFHEYLSPALALAFAFVAAAGLLYALTRGKQSRQP